MASLRRVLSRTGGVRSLSQLVALVAEDLQKRDPGYRLGPERVRRVAARMNAVKTTIYARRGDGGGPDRECPVCGAALERVRNRTLSGGSIELQARCTECPYWTGRVRRIPTRYAFALREWSFA